MTNSTLSPIHIIGGGLAGLASACTLAARGHQVVLFERNEWLGGKAAHFGGWARVFSHTHQPTCGQPLDACVWAVVRDSGCGSWL